LPVLFTTPNQPLLQHSLAQQHAQSAPASHSGKPARPLPLKGSGTLQTLQPECPGPNDPGPMTPRKKTGATTMNKMSPGGAASLKSTNRSQVGLLANGPPLAPAHETEPKTIGNPPTAAGGPATMKEAMKITPALEVQTTVGQGIPTTLTSKVPSQT
jgi:hypothetical protein